MKKIMLAFAVMVATAFAVSASIFVWRMLEVNDWIDRCSDETSGKYLMDLREREEYCARTVESISRDL